MCGIPQWLAQVPAGRKVSLGFESRPGTLSNSDEKKRKENLRPIMQSQCGSTLILKRIKKPKNIQEKTKINKTAKCQQTFKISTQRNIR